MPNGLLRIPLLSFHLFVLLLAFMDLHVVSSASLVNSVESESKRKVCIFAELLLLQHESNPPNGV